MAEEWINARNALCFAASSLGKHSAISAICRRAYQGALAAKATTFSIDGNTEHNCLVPKEFWWAEGHEALEQDWQVGDFSTWIKRKEHWQAFDVSFDFEELVNLVPAVDRSTALNAISVAGSSDWVPAREASNLVLRLDGVVSSLEALVEYCRTGRAVARSVRMCMTARAPHAPVIDARVEWDVPLWFWRDFVADQPPYELWANDKVVGAGEKDRRQILITLQGVHFHRAGLEALGVPELKAASPPLNVQAGRKPKYDWFAAGVAIYGKLERGELKPQVQADIEQALIAHLSIDDDGPTESTARPYAKLIWEEYRKP